MWLITDKIMMTSILYRLVRSSTAMSTEQTMMEK